MTEARDITSYALPFTAATAAAVYAGISPHNTIFTSAIILVISIISLILLHPGHHTLSRESTITFLIVLASCTGLICGITSNTTTLSAGISDIGIIGRYAIDAGRWCREQIASISFADQQTNAIISALITGDKSLLSEQTVLAFRDSGASHILALSGLHLGIIYGILHYLTKPLGKSRKAEYIRSISIMLSCGFYTLATGAGPSVTRAFLFILIGETARLKNRYRDIRSTLMAALIIQIALNPSDIRSAGFQLSYMAIAGIAYIYPWMKSLWPEGKDFPILRKIWNSICMSVSCQITTGPIAWIYFHSFPTHFLLTNLIAIPLTGIIIPLSLLTLALSSTGICPDILINTTEALIMAMTRALETISLM
jgi:competence protein ComEC